MSLQVWLPLNGNLENRGLYDTEITNSNCVTSTQSIFNKSFSFNGTNSYIKMHSPIKKNEDMDFSISFWIYFNTVGKTQTLFCQRTVVGSGLCAFLISKQIRIDYASAQRIFNFYPKACVWYNICVTRKNKIINLYINGILLKSDSTYLSPTINMSDNIIIGNSNLDTSNSLGNMLDGNMNDFRIYDHCLSDKEVKEISKGLYIHYPLNQIDKSNNLIKNSSSGYTYSGFNVSSNCINGVTDFKNENGVMSWNGAITGNNVGPYFNINSKFGYIYEVGKIYTFSFDGKCDCDNIKIRPSGIAENHTILKSTDLIFTNTFKRYYVTFITKTDVSNICFYNDTGSLVTSDKPRIYIKNIKLELGENTNPIWTPNFEDTNKWYDTIEYDMSGFGNDGTLTTTNSNTSSNDTPRNNYSYYLDKNSEYRINPNYSYEKIVYNCSFGIWCKKITTVNANQNIISFGGNSFMRFRLNPNNTITVFAFLPGTTNSDNIIIPSYVDIYDWNYYMVTFNNGIYKFYLNGELLNTTDKSTTRTFLTYTNSNWFIGRYNISTSVNPECLDGALFSDFRYYVTTLSDKDILELYNRPISLTDKGEIFTQGEIVENEVDGVSYKKNGIMESKSISNIPQILNMETKELDDGSVWAKVFYHNCKAGTILFTSYNEVMYTDTDNKYSRLNILGNFKGNDDKYEFLLEYPNEFPNQYNRWKQSKNPCDEYYGTSNGELFVDGYEAIHIDWTSQSWGGLARQNSNTQSALSCFLSGSIGSGTWYYSVGASTKWGNGIPGPYGNVTNAINVVQLWVRIDNLPQSIDVKLYDKYIECSDIVEY